MTAAGVSCTVHGPVVSGVTRVVLSVAPRTRPAGSPRVVELIRTYPGDAIAVLKLVVPLVEPGGALVPDADTLLERAVAAGFTPYDEGTIVPGELVHLLVRYPMIGPPVASIRVAAGRGTTTYPLDTFRARVSVLTDALPPA